MKQSFQETGRWWLPSAPNEQATGILIFEPSEGSRLSGIVGGWIGNAAAVVIAEETFPPAPPLIVGRSDSGALYTCLGNDYAQFFHNEVEGGGGLDTADIEVRTVLKGRHFTHLDDVVFRRFSWIYSNLHCWLDGLPGLAIKGVPNEERAYVVRHARTVLWEVAVAGNITVSNTYSFQTNRIRHNPNPKLTFSHRDGCLITSQQPRTLGDAFGTEHRFRSLVNLLGDCQLELAEIKFNAIEVGGPGNVECFDERMTRGFAQREDARRGSMPVPFSEIANQFDGILQRWFELYEQLGPVVALYLFGKHNRYLVQENIFIGLMQALERFHRSFYGGSFIPQAEYDATVRPLLDAAIPPLVQEDFRQRLRSAIQYGYEFSLRRRLRELVAGLPNTGTFAEAKSNALLGASVDTRNALAHQLHGADVSLLTGPAMYNAINIWRETLFALVLDRLGIQPTIIDLAVRRLQASRGTLIVH